MERMPRMFAVTPIAIAARIGRDDDGRFVGSIDYDGELARFMRPLLTDAERIAGMANALRQWCATVEHERARRTIYSQLGIPEDAATRLDAPALRCLQTMVERERT